VSQTPATETWESRAPDGRRWLVKVLFRVAGPAADRTEAVLRLHELRHPNLVPTHVLPGSPGCLVVAAPAPTATLLDRVQQSQAQGAPGIPRPLLLGWLRKAAETLDDLWQRHGVAHLALTPWRIVLAGDTLLLADHGFAQLMWLPAGQFADEVRSRYAAPESSKLAHAHCDQFSLAAIFQELLTGVPPFPERPVGAPDLTPLPEPDREVIARALDFDPNKRFLCCADLVDALEQVRLKPCADPPALPAIAPTARLEDAAVRPARAEPPPLPEGAPAVPAAASVLPPKTKPQSAGRIANPSSKPKTAVPTAILLPSAPSQPAGRTGTPSDNPKPAVAPPSSPPAPEMPFVIVSYTSGPEPASCGLPPVPPLASEGNPVRADTAALDEVFARAAARLRQIPLLSLPAGVDLTVTP
jgi:hypothetical protein